MLFKNLFLLYILFYLYFSLISIHFLTSRHAYIDHDFIFVCVIHRFRVILLFRVDLQLESYVAWMNRNIIKTSGKFMLHTGIRSLSKCQCGRYFTCFPMLQRNLFYGQRSVRKRVSEGNLIGTYKE